MVDVNRSEEERLDVSQDDAEPALSAVVGMFAEQAGRLRAGPSFELLLDCCSASRYTWARLYMDYLLTGVFYEDLAARFRDSLDAVIKAAGAVPACQTPEQAELVGRYVQSIRLRRDLLVILMREGARAVERELDRRLAA